MLGTSVENIQDTFKHFNALADAHGGTNFGTIHYTHIHALTEYVWDQQQWHGQVPDATGFTDMVMNGYIGHRKHVRCTGCSRATKARGEQLQPVGRCHPCPTSGEDG